MFFIDIYQCLVLTIINGRYILITVNRTREKGKRMATIAENNVRAFELIVEQLRVELNDAIAEYEDAIEHPNYYDLEAAEREMNNRQRWYDEAVSDLENEREIAAMC